jgi:hypothetical protein
MLTVVFDEEDEFSIYQTRFPGCAEETAKELVADADARNITKVAVFEGEFCLAHWFANKGWMVYDAFRYVEASDLNIKEIKNPKRPAYRVISPGRLAPVETCEVDCIGKP